MAGQAPKATQMLPQGTQAPDFTLPDAAGAPQSLAEALRGGPVLLVFFKITCPICQYALPFVDRLWRQLKDKPATLWAISQDSPEHTEMFNEEFGVQLPQLFDSEEAQYPVSDAYGITIVPSLFLVEQGVISLTSVGWNRAEIEAISVRLAELTGAAGLTPFEPGETIASDRPGCASKN